MTIAARRKLIESLETISHQYGRDFFLELTHAFDDLKKGFGDKNTRQAAIAKIEAVTAKATGITVDFQVEMGMFYDAYMYPPDIKNNPIIPNDVIGFFNDEDPTKVLKAEDVKPNGTIDLKKGIITGIYTKIPIRIRLSSPFFETTRYEPAEVAAIYAHELGHAFTFFAMTTMVVKTNHAIRSIRQSLDGTTDKKIRYDLLTEHEKKNNVAIPNKNTIVDGADMSATVYIFKAYQEHYRNEYGLDLYDRRSSEYLADQFVTRIGGARPLATGLSRLFKDCGHPSYWNFLTFGIVELIKVFAVGIYFFVPVLLFLMFGDPMKFGETSRYDPPGARLKRIKHQAIDSLKSKTIKPEQRKLILEEIAIIEKLESEVKDRESLYETVYGFIFPWARKVRKDINEQKLLEELGNNGLYVSAAKLKDLT